MSKKTPEHSYSRKNYKLDGDYAYTFPAMAIQKDRVLDPNVLFAFKNMQKI